MGPPGLGVAQEEALLRGEAVDLLDGLALEELQRQFHGEVGLKYDFLGHGYATSGKLLNSDSAASAGWRRAIPSFFGVITRGFSLHRVPAIAFVGGIPVRLQFFGD